jgi:hypothetical protein
VHDVGICVFLNRDAGRGVGRGHEDGGNRAVCVADGPADEIRHFDEFISGSRLQFVANHD